MIRDCWRVDTKSNQLWAEIKAIEDKVDPETWEAVKAVKDIGNIGAHMQGDVNVIVDVEPKEAELLIEPIESLFDEWYVQRDAALKEAAAGNGGFLLSLIGRVVASWPVLCIIVRLLRH
jgi:Domain of unknown function (DUF4145)